MKNKLIKSIILVLLAIIICIPSKAYASGGSDEKINNAGGLDKIINNGDNFLKKQDLSIKTIRTESLDNTSNWIYHILFIIGLAVSLIVGFIIAIQFITGSVEQQAKVKETLVPYIIGVFVIVASVTIWKIAINIGNAVAPNPTVDGTWKQNIQNKD